MVFQACWVAVEQVPCTLEREVHELRINVRAQVQGKHMPIRRKRTV